MPRISTFYGVVIYMHWNERDHPVAHFHAALQFVREWARLRQDEILVNWERARRNEPLLGIEPLA